MANGRDDILAALQSLEGSLKPATAATALQRTDSKVKPPTSLSFSQPRLPSLADVSTPKKALTRTNSDIANPVQDEHANMAQISQVLYASQKQTSIAPVKIQGDECTSPALSHSVLISPQQQEKLVVIDDYSPPKAGSRRSQSLASEQTTPRASHTRISSTNFIRQGLPPTSIKASPLKRRSVNSLNISEDQLNGLRTHAKKVLKAIPYACDWTLAKYDVKDFSAFSPDSYVLILTDAKVEVYYLDEKHFPKKIPLEKVPGIAKLLKQSEPGSISPRISYNKNNFEMNKAIDDCLSHFRTTEQKKRLHDTKPVWLKTASNPDILYHEGFCTNLYHLIDDHSPRAFIYTDSDSKRIFLGTENASGFTSFREEFKDKPLTEEHFKVDSFTFYNPIETFVERESNFTDLILDKATIANPEKILFSVTLNTNPIISHHVTCDEYKKYLHAKFLGTAEVKRYCFDENDFTANNYGLLADLDNDYSLHHLACRYKDAKYFVDGIYRKPNPDAYEKHWEDMESLPVFTTKNAKASYFYFPGNPAPVGSMLSFNNNAFTPEENKIFAKQTHNSVVNYHKHKTFLKIALLNDEKLLRNIVDSMIDDNPNDPHKKFLANELVNSALKNINDVRDELVKWPNFKKFLNEKGEFTIKVIKKEFAEHQEQAIDSEEIQARYDHLFKIICREILVNVSPKQSTAFPLRNSGNNVRP